MSVLIPVPYVILSPGLTENTLGKDLSGKAVITITGRRTYPTSGHLNLVTVSYVGGPGTDISIFQAAVYLDGLTLVEVAPAARRPVGVVVSESRR